MVIKSKKYKNWLSLCHQWPISINQGWLGYFLPVERSERAKNPILPFRKKIIKLLPPLIWPQTQFSVHFRDGVWENSTFVYTHFSPKRPFLVSWGAVFGQKHGKYGVFFFQWSSQKCKSLRKFWYLELFWWDLLCNLTLRTFRGTPVKKTPCTFIT